MQKLLHALVGDAEQLSRIADTQAKLRHEAMRGAPEGLLRMPLLGVRSLAKATLLLERPTNGRRQQDLFLEACTSRVRDEQR